MPRRVAHNKAIVTDGKTVSTGSCNFTRSADTRNAENVVVLRGREVAGWFTRNWERRGRLARVRGGVALDQR